MNTALNWLLPMGENGPWATMVVLLAKVTVLLGVAWCLHGLLRRGNPRWRVLLWRSATAGTLLLLVMAACPPVWSWAILPVEADGPQPAPVTASPIATEQVVGMEPQVAEIPLPEADPEPLPVVSEVAEAPIAHTNSIAAILPVIVGVWLIGVSVLGVWTAVGLHRLRMIVRRSQPSADWIREQAERIKETLGCGRALEIRTTSEIATPCLVGIWRPVVLLPEERVDCERSEELAAILLHETAHLAGRDLWWNGLLHWLSLLLWPHPLAWQMRLAHAGACEAVADTIAADHVGDVSCYIRTLARLVVEMHHPVPESALAMARASSVMQRIEALQRKLFLGRLSRTRVLSAVALGAVIVASLGGVALTRAATDDPQEVVPRADETLSAEPATKENQLFLDVIEFEAETGTQPPGVKARFRGGTAGQLVIHATAKETGEPLEGVKIHFQGSLNRKAFDHDLVTSDEGTAGLHWPPSVEFGRLFMSCQKDGFVPIRYLWRDHRARDEQIPKQLDLQFETGKWIGGIVQDQSGRPIEGATVKVRTIYHYPRPGYYWGTVGELKTDADGRWKWKGVPDDLSQYSIDIEHPDYVEGMNQLRAGTETTYVMKRSGRLTGRVLAEDGKPIERASVLLGHHHSYASVPKTTTDADGRFVLENCPPGESLVTVDDMRYSPAQRKVVVGEEEDLGEFRLGPGHTIRVRVVNGRGEPVKGALFEVASWRGTDTLCCLYSTDAEGRVVWEGAPEDTVLCNIRAADYLEVRRHPLQASNEEHVITLLSELTIRGKVTDAETGQPIPEFVVRRGFDSRATKEIAWVRSNEISFKDGAYEFKIDQQIDGAHRLRVEVPGYRVAVSRPFKDDEGAVTYDFVLERGKAIEGIVLGPAGDPADGAEVGLATEGGRAYLNSGGFLRMANQAEKVVTDGTGKFAFLPQEDAPFLLIVVHDSGFAMLTREQFEESSEVRLKSWGRIEGQVLAGDQPDASCRVQYSPELTDDQKKFFRGCFYWTNSDGNGRFELERVIPGSGKVARVTTTAFPRGATLSPGWQQAVDVAAGETVTVKIGGVGRLVVGRFEFDRDPGLTPNWASLPVKIQRWDTNKDRAIEPAYECYGHIDSAGRFEIRDIPPGDYRLTRSIWAVMPADSKTRTKIGSAEYDFTVPEGGESAKSLDLGIITVNAETKE